ncbi:uncharacterized protein G2W53_005298 [Senna tora]|uniref:Uncharacterized protein n=1 Tax=Senna tora TaxID=362788 RepID=A0A835CK37_9FABA|nr:uncharacterized protein G2W53_005298 [Senna tora]
MSRREQWVTQNFRVVLHLLRASKIESNYGGFQRNSLVMPKSKLGNGYWMHPGLQFYSTNRFTSSDSYGVKNVKAQQPVPSSPSFIFPNWLKWALGSVVSLLLPLWTHNLQTLQKIEGEADILIEEVEEVAKAVEEVANVTDELAEEVAQHFGEDSKLEKAALVVENVSKEAVNVTEEFIHKVDELKKDLNDLESSLQPFIDEKESERK